MPVWDAERGPDHASRPRAGSDRNEGRSPKPLRAPAVLAVLVLLLSLATTAQAQGSEPAKPTGLQATMSGSSTVKDPPGTALRVIPCDY